MVTLAVIVQSPAKREEFDALHGHGTVSRAVPRRDHGTFVPAARRPYSLISSGPSGTSMSTRPSSTTTG